MAVLNLPGKIDLKAPEHTLYVFLNYSPFLFVLFLFVLVLRVSPYCLALGTVIPYPRFRFACATGWQGSQHRTTAPPYSLFVTRELCSKENYYAKYDLKKRVYIGPTSTVGRGHRASERAGE